MVSCDHHENSQKTHRVLVLHSWDSVGEEGDPFTKVMAEEFADLGMKVEIKHVYANLMHRPLDLFQRMDWPRLRKDIIQFNPEVILLNDDPILDWVQKYNTADTLFVNTPSVFAGVSAVCLDNLHSFPLMTGFEDKIDIGKNLDMIRKVAHTNNVVVELDGERCDRVLHAALSAQLSDSLRFIDNSNFQIQYENIDTLRERYPNRMIVNFVSCAFPGNNRSDKGTEKEALEWTTYMYFRARTYWHLQVKQDIVSNSMLIHNPYPQFTAIREQFNNPRDVRFLGGYFTSMKTQVKDQVDYAARILKGELVKNLPIGVHMGDYYMDWNAMQKMPEALPYAPYAKRYRIVNAPFYLESPWKFAVVFGSGILIIVASIILIVRLMLRWRWKKEVKIARDLKYEGMVQNLVFSRVEDALWSFKEGVFELNAEFADYFRLSSKYLTVDEMRYILHPESKTSFRYLLDFRNQRGRKTVRLCLTPDKGKNWHWAEAIYTATDESAETGEIYGLLINVDSQKEIEETLGASQVLARQVELKENFLANISHDLRTPLGAVTGFSTMLTTLGMTFEEGEREQYAEIIHQNTDMILDMIDSVMQKAQVETGDLEIIQKPSSIQKLINECYKTNRIIAPTHLQFNLETAKTDAMLNIDVTRTKQVVNNFLSNAFKFTTEGSVTLGWKYMKEDPDEIEVYVKDTGIGVPEEKQASLFERYVKVNETDKGTGLGLNISKTIMTKQEGTIGVESKPGHGSKFFFRLHRIVGCLLLILSLGAGWLLPSSCLRHYAGRTKNAKILVFHTFDREYHGYEAFHDRMTESFRNNGINPEMRHVYLNLKNPNEDHIRRYEAMKDSMHRTPWTPDAVIIEGDRAARELLNFRDGEIFRHYKNLPVVMGGVHHPDWTAIRKHSNIVVFNDPIDYATNIKLAAEMTRNNSVNIEVDYFEMDTLIRKELKEAIARPPFVDNSDFHVKYDWDGVRQERYKNSVIVNAISVANPERNGGKAGHTTVNEGYLYLRRFYVTSWKVPSLTVKHDLFSASIAEKTGRPQFTAVKGAFADGTARYLCGYFSSFETVGEDVARVAAEMLYGAPVSSYVGLNHRLDYYMDYQAMERLGMKYEDYKDRFNIVNREYKGKNTSFSTSMLFTVLIIFVFALGAIVLVLQSWKDRSSQNMVDELKRRAEIRQMAMRGAESHVLHTEETLKEVLSHVHPHYSSEIPFIMQSINVEGTHDYEIYSDVDHTEVYRWWNLRFVVKFEGRTRKKSVVGVLINIDEAKKREEDLRQAMLFAEEAKQKENFLTTISHEIRTPLNAVVGFSDVLVNMPSGIFSSEEMDEYAKIIKTNNNSLSTMIEDILMFSRIESGRIQYVKNEFDAAELIRELATDWEELISEDITIQQMAIQPGVVVNNDRTRIKYILNQLMSNSVKFTSKGMIFLSIMYHLNEDVVEFMVGDTGIGIDKEGQKHVFDLFWKHDSFVPGLGLGLSVARKLADGMGLTLSVDSKPGFGSRFSLKCPASLAGFSTPPPYQQQSIFSPPNPDVMASW